MKVKKQNETRVSHYLFLTAADDNFLHVTQHVDAIVFVFTAGLTPLQLETLFFFQNFFKLV